MSEPIRASEVAPLHLLGCPDCGQVLPHIEEAVDARDRQIVSLRAVVAQLQGDLDNVERELRAKRSEIKRLKGESERQLKASPYYETAMTVMRYWRDKLKPKARELNGPRAALVIARLKAGHTPEGLMKAVDGYAAYPYVVDGSRLPSGPESNRYVDAELVFRDAKRVEAGIALAERALSRRTAAVEPLPSPEKEMVQVEGVLGAGALWYARHGLMVFPVKEKEKVPAVRNGLHAASTDLDKIAACWSKHPNLNVGVRTGSASGIVVLDVDGDTGYDSLARLESEYGGLPKTFSTTTPSGGAHFWFQHPGREVHNTAGWPGPGLDVRGDGGYVLAPPSASPSGRYELDEQAEFAPMPPWLLDLLLKGQKMRAEMTDEQWAALYRGDIPEGQRNNTMARLVGKELSAHGNTPSKVELVRSVCQSVNRGWSKPLPVKEVDAVVDSIVARDRRGR